MSYKITQWEYSNEVVNERPMFEEGDRLLRIASAGMDPETHVYSVEVDDLWNGAHGTFKYWMNTRDKQGNEIKDEKQRGTLISIGKALFGQSVGIPNPIDIEGGVLIGEIVYSKPNAEGKSYARIYKYKPAKKADVEENSYIEQYSI